MQVVSYKVLGGTYHGHLIEIMRLRVILENIYTDKISGSHGCQYKDNSLLAYRPNLIEVNRRFKAAYVYVA
jgi:hypothetical protein